MIKTTIQRICDVCQGDLAGQESHPDSRLIWRDWELASEEGAIAAMSWEVDARPSPGVGLVIGYRSLLAPAGDLCRQCALQGALRRILTDGGLDVGKALVAIRETGWAAFKSRVQMYTGKDDGGRYHASRSDGYAWCNGIDRLLELGARPPFEMASSVMCAACPWPVWSEKV